MIGYVTLGTNDLAKGVKFYDGLAAVMGAKRFMEEDTFVAWTGPNNEPGVAITIPFDKNTATVGNGTMVALQVETPDQVKAVYNKALELGGTCEGEPGPRGGGFYAGYFRDLDGNKLNAFCMVAE